MILGSRLAASAGGLLLLCLGTILTLTGRSIIKEASEMKIRPSRISLDASEGRGRALMSVDAELRLPEAGVHGVTLHQGRCDLRGTKDGEPLLGMHLVEALYHGVAQAHFDVELEHGSLQEALAVLQERANTPTLDCVLGVELDPFRTGWTFRTQRAMSLPIGNMLQGTGCNVRFVKRGPREVVLPTLGNMTAACTATYGLEFVIPTERIPQILPSLEDIPMDVKGGITYIEGDLGAADTRMHVDAPVELRTEGTGPSTSTIFAVPVRISGRADLVAAGVVLSAAAVGERAQWNPEDRRHYRIQPAAGDPRPPHSVVFAAASPASAIAKALGPLHTVSLQPDEKLGADTLAEALAKGRKLLGRKLSGGTMEGVGLRLHHKLLLDETMKMRVDLDVAGGTPLDPALQLDVGLLLRMPESEERNWGSSSWEWREGGTAVNATARVRLDHQTPAISGGAALNLVEMLDKSEKSCDSCGPRVEHEVRNATTSVDFSLDGATMQATFGMILNIAMLEDSMEDSNYSAMAWATSTNETSPAKVWWQQNQEVRRLLSRAGDVAWQTGTSLRRLAIRTEQESENIPVRVNASIDLDGAGMSSVFDAGIIIDVQDVLGVRMNWAITEPTTKKYDHDVSFSLNLAEGMEVKAGEVIAPLLAAGASIRDENMSAQEDIKLGMKMQVSANLVTDFSDNTKLKVGGTVSMHPECSVSAQDRTLPKIQPLLQNLSASFDASNPQCRRCGSTDDQPFQVQGMDSMLVSRCNSSEPGWSGTRWGGASSCCDFKSESTKIMQLGGLLEGSNGQDLVFGSQWTSKNYQLTFNHGEDLLDVWAWLENTVSVPAIAGLIENETRLISDYTTVGNTKVRTWKMMSEGSELVNVTMEDKFPGEWFNIDWDIKVDAGGQPIHVMLTEEWTDGKIKVNVTTAMQGSPEGSIQALVAFDTNGDVLDGFTMLSYLRMNHSQKFRVHGNVAHTDGTSDGLGTIAGGGEFYLEEEKLGSVNLTLVNSAGLNMGVDGALGLNLEDGPDLSTYAASLSLSEVTADKLALTGSLSNSTMMWYSLVADAKRLAGESAYSMSLAVMNESSDVFVGLAGNFSKITGNLLATLDVEGEQMVKADGTMPLSSTFFVGDVALMFDNQTQRLWMNASDGFLPFSKAGLSGFERFYLGGGAVIEDACAVNASAYLEFPPYDPTFFSGVGISADVDLLDNGRKPLVSVGVEVDFPYSKTGTSSSGEALEVVGEVVQRMHIKVGLGDSSTFDEDAYKAQMASMMPWASAVEIERVEYKVEVAYSFDAAITEAEAKTSIATTVGVQPDKVSVTITNSRRRLFSDLLVPRRRLGGTRVDAEILSDAPDAAQTIKGKADDLTKLTQELANLNKIVTPSIEKAPEAEVQVKMKMKSEPAAQRPTAQAINTGLQDVGRAMGMTVSMEGDISQGVEWRPVVVTTTPYLLANGEIGKAPSHHLQSAVCGALLVAAIAANMRVF